MASIAPSEGGRMELEGGGGADPPQVVGGKSERLSRARAQREKAMEVPERRARDSVS